MTMTCDQLDTLLPEFLDGSLTTGQEEQAAAHLATCDQCRVQVSQLESVGELYRTHGRMTLPQEAKDRILGILTAESGNRPHNETGDM